MPFLFNQGCIHNWSLKHENVNYVDNNNIDKQAVKNGEDRRNQQPFCLLMHIVVTSVLYLFIFFSFSFFWPLINGWEQAAAFKCLALHSFTVKYKHKDDFIYIYIYIRSNEDKSRQENKVNDDDVITTVRWSTGA